MCLYSLSKIGNRFTKFDDFMKQNYSSSRIFRESWWVVFFFQFSNFWIPRQFMPSTKNYSAIKIALQIFVSRSIH